MYKKIFISLFIIFFMTNISNTSSSMSNINDNEKEITININNKDIEVDVVDINKFEDFIDIEEKYSYYYVLTIKVKNKGDYDIDLANIDIYPYQGYKSTKYFVNNSNDNINGFIGTLKSGENKEIKIGILLYNKYENIKIDLDILDNTYKEYK